MKYLFALFVMSFFACESQSLSSAKNPMEFEVVNHFPYELTGKKFLIIDTQQKMDAVYSIIHKNTVGNRLAPVPSVTDDEVYVVIKPQLKNANDVEVKGISVAGDTLYIEVQDFDNPQIGKNTRVQPNILLKLLGKPSVKNIVTTHSN